MVRTGRTENLFPDLSRSAALPLAVAALAALFVLLGFGSRPPAPQPATAPPDVFSAGRAVALLEHLLADDTPHPVGTPENYLVRDRIMTELERLGYRPHVQSEFACAPIGSCAPVQNIVARLDGTRAGPAILLNAHYDSRAAAPGAADNGAGVAALLEVARILRSEAPFRNPVILLFTDGEEAGLLGAEAFVRGHPWADDVAIVINLEARGTRGPSIMFETSDGNAWLVRTFARAVKRPVASSLTDAVYGVLPNDTDATVFMRAGAAVLNFAFIRDVAHYHTSLDDVAHLSLRSLQHHGDNALSLVRVLAATTLRRSAGDVAYTDVFGVAMIVFPAAWTLPLAVAFTVLLLAACAALVARRVIRGRQLAWAVGGVAAAVVAALLLAAGAAWLIGRGSAQPVAGTVAMWAAAASGVCAAALLTAPRSGARALLLAAWLVIGVLCIALAATLHAGAVVLLLPLGVASLIIGLHLVAPDRVRPAVDTATVLAAVAAGFTLLQLARLLQWTFELQLPLVLAVPVLITALTLMPLFAVAPRSRIPALALAVAAVTLVAAVSAALYGQAYSAQRPQPMSLLHVEDADAGAARWVVTGAADATAVPAAWRAAGGFTDGPPLPWSAPAARAVSSPAPRYGILPPQLAVVADEPVAGGPAADEHVAGEPVAGEPVAGEPVAGEPVAGAPAASGRRVSARLFSPRAAGRVVLLLPRDVVTEIIVQGVAVRPARTAHPDYMAVTVHGLPPAGVRIELTFDGPEPRTIMLYDAAGFGELTVDPTLRAAAVPILHARPERAVPAHDGDRSIVVTRIRL